MNDMFEAFRRLLAEKHTVQYASGAPTRASETHRDVWTSLVDAGWLDCGLEDFQSEYWETTMLLGEAAGRHLLTLPFGYSAFVVTPLLNEVQTLRNSQALSRPADTPAAGLVRGPGDTMKLFDFKSQAEHHYEIALNDGRSGLWTVSRYHDDALEAVEAVDACIRLGSPTSAEPQVSVSCKIDPVVMGRILQRYIAFELSDMVGAASASIEMAVEYATTRSQFGRQIGEYQSVKHALANAWVAVDNGRYVIRDLLRRTARNVDRRDSACAASAQRIVSAAAKQATRQAIQVHGAIGFSWEHAAHLFLKRVHRNAIRTSQLVNALHSLDT